MIYFNLREIEREILKKLLSCEILRTAIIAKLDAVNLYEQLAAATDNEKIKKCFWKLLGKRKPILRVSSVAFKGGRGTSQRTGGGK